MRSEMPSVHDLWSDLSTSHRLDSDPAGARWLDRRVGRALRLALRWWITTKGGTAFTAAVSVGIAWLTAHLAHWLK
jgi:hypothetical protein